MDHTKAKKEYWDGSKNKSIRFYFYSQRGLALFNEFRYLFMLIFGLYVLMKLSNPVWLVGMFVVSLPLLILFGWIQVHHLAKVMDWLNIEFATYWSRYQFDLQERQVKAVESIDSKVSSYDERRGCLGAYVYEGGSSEVTFDRS